MEKSKKKKEEYSCIKKKNVFSFAITASVC